MQIRTQAANKDLLLFKNMVKITIKYTSTVLENNSEFDYKNNLCTFFIKARPYLSEKQLILIIIYQIPVYY